MALPLTGGGCYPNHNANTPVFNDLCSDWKVEKVEAVRQGDDVLVKVAGAYKEFSGSYDLKINAGGELSVTYSFDALEDVNPRQWGLVFEAPVSYDKTFWRRDGMWSVYPADHISRPVGEARPVGQTETVVRLPSLPMANSTGAPGWKKTRSASWLPTL